MPLFDFLKRKKERLEKKIEKKIDQPKADQPRAGKKVEVRPQPLKKRVSKIAYRVLASPHVTEKATTLEKDNKYIFKVFPRANKTEIKKGINELYGVDVIDIKIINIHRKKRKVGRRIGWKKGYKKAIIRLKKGQKIEIISR